MKVSKQSWHCGVVRYILGESYFHDRVNLCKYFWTVVVTLISVPFIAIGRAFPRPSIHEVPKVNTRVIFLAAFVGWPVGWGAFTEYMFGTGLKNGLIVAGVLWGTLGTLHLLEWWRKTHPHKPYERRIIKPTEPNLLVEYIKAKKRKICPLIEFV